MEMSFLMVGRRRARRRRRKNGRFKKKMSRSGRFRGPSANLLTIMIAIFKNPGKTRSFFYFLAAAGDRGTHPGKLFGSQTTHSQSFSEIGDQKLAPPPHHPPHLISTAENRILTLQFPFSPRFLYKPTEYSPLRSVDL